MSKWQCGGAVTRCPCLAAAAAAVPCPLRWIHVELVTAFDRSNEHNHAAHKPAVRCNCRAASRFPTASSPAVSPANNIANEAKTSDQPAGLPGRPPEGEARSALQLGGPALAHCTKI